MGKVEGLPKTEQSFRDIDMLEPVYDLLRRHRGETLQHSDYVFILSNIRAKNLLHCVSFERGPKVVLFPLPCALRPSSSWTILPLTTHHASSILCGQIFG